METMSNEVDRLLTENKELKNKQQSLQTNN